MSEGLSKEQRKRQKRREAQKRKKIEKSKQSQLNAEEDVGAAPDGDVSSVNCLSEKEEDMEEDNFESELCWCIEQLELGIKNKKPSKNEGERATKLIKVLKSEKTSKIKKRQVMRSTFGDYRKKISAEAKQDSSNVTAEPTIAAVSKEKIKGSLFIKKKDACQSTESNDQVLEEDKDTRTKWRFLPSDNDFQFSFPDPK